MFQYIEDTKSYRPVQKQSSEPCNTETPKTHQNPTTTNHKTMTFCFLRGSLRCKGEKA